jgi:uncharacterized protein YcbK (DUF882 family)
MFMSTITLKSRITNNNTYYISTYEKKSHSFKITRYYLNDELKKLQFLFQKFDLIFKVNIFFSMGLVKTEGLFL